MTSQLRIQLFGGFQAQDANRRLARLNTPRTQALLAYLILQRAAPQPRYHIAFQLWPDVPEAQARANLRYQLHLLRKALPEPERYLYVDEHVLHWRAASDAFVDVVAFEAAIEASHTAEQAGDWTAWRSALEQASLYYRGEVLPSCYDDWIVSERERLQQLFTHNLERLIGWLAEQRELHAAIAAAQRLLCHDPLHEAAYRQLMALQHAAGDDVAALRTYHTCVAVLQRELAVKPSRETRALHARLRASSTAADSAPCRDNGRAQHTDKTLHNLPTRLSSFVGREHELAEISSRLDRERLLTLTGPGGAGKTRLALEAATARLLAGSYAHGVWYIALDALAEPALVPQALATALGVREERDQPLTQVLLQRLQSQHLLLLFDNCEHVLRECAQLIELLLGACPHVSVLATSREPLRIDGEVVWLVPSLSLPQLHGREPPKLDALLQAGAVRLFVERAAAILPSFQLTHENAHAVMQICRKLDGIPLAIELAAARVRILTVEQIALRLDNVFTLLTASNRPGLQARHRTLQATLDWSHQLLDEHERALFRRLAVFAGSFSLDAVEQVCAGIESDGPQTLDLLAQLVDRSLVIADTQTQPEARYRLLETVRQYAREKLSECGELHTMHRRHAQYFLARAEAGDAGLATPSQAQWLYQLEQEHDNFRAALNWTLRGGDLTLGLRLGGELARFWWIRGHTSEGNAYLEQLLARGVASQPDARERAMRGAYLLAWRLGNMEVARELAAACLAIHRAHGNQKGMAHALLMLSNAVSALGDDSQALTLLAESLALSRALDDRWGIANALNNIAEIVRVQGDYARAAAYYAEGLQRYEELGLTEAAALLMHNLGQTCIALGDSVSAEQRFHASLAVYQELQHKTGIAMCLAGLANVAVAHGEPGRAARLAGAVEQLLQSVGGHLDPADALCFEAALACAHELLGAEGFAAEQAAGCARAADADPTAILKALEEFDLRCTAA